MKMTELKDKSVADLKQLKVDLLKEHFNLRVQKSIGQLSKNHLMGRVRRDIARVEMLLTQKAGA